MNSARPCTNLPWTETADGPRLIGGKSKSDGRITFPVPEGSTADMFEPVLLKTQGRLWSYTIQRFPPKSPPYLGVNDRENFKPYAVGYVELVNEVIVESRIITENPEALRIGQKMELTIIEIARADGSGNIPCHAFQPTGNGE